MIKDLRTETSLFVSKEIQRKAFPRKFHRHNLYCKDFQAATVNWINIIKGILLKIDNRKSIFVFQLNLDLQVVEVATWAEDPHSPDLLINQSQLTTLIFWYHCCFIVKYVCNEHKNSSFSAYRSLFINLHLTQHGEFRYYFSS